VFCALNDITAAEGTCYGAARIRHAPQRGEA